MVSLEYDLHRTESRLDDAYKENGELKAKIKELQDKLVIRAAAQPYDIRANEKLLEAQLEVAQKAMIQAKAMCWRDECVEGYAVLEDAALEINRLYEAGSHELNKAQLKVAAKPDAKELKIVELTDKLTQSRDFHDAYKERSDILNEIYKANIKFLELKIKLAETCITQSMEYVESLGDMAENSTVALAVKPFYKYLAHVQFTTGKEVPNEQTST